MNAAEIKEAITRLVKRPFDAATLRYAFLEGFGNPIVPREWFLVPLFVIHERVDESKDGSIVRCAHIVRCAYDVSKQEIKEHRR